VLTPAGLLFQIAAFQNSLFNQNLFHNVPVHILCFLVVACVPLSSFLSGVCSSRCHKKRVNVAYNANQRQEEKSSSVCMTKQLY
jgi:hypothetical protein